MVATTALLTQTLPSPAHPMPLESPPRNVGPFVGSDAFATPSKIADGAVLIFLGVSSQYFLPDNAETTARMPLKASQPLTKVRLPFARVTLVPLSNGFQVVVSS